MDIPPETKFFKIKKWRQFQHYRDRNPPWVKLHFEMLTSADWVMLSDASRLLFIACMLIASRHDGLVPNKPDYIKRVAYLNRKPDFKPLIECGFLVIPQADAIEREQGVATARPETEAETEEEEEEEAKTKILNKQPRSLVTLDELSIEQNAEWLAQQRSVGNYLDQNEHNVLENFKNICKAHGKNYEDYLAAYRASFNWPSNNPKSHKRQFSQQNKNDRAREAAMRAARSAGLA